MTTTKPVRQNLDNKVSLTGKVMVNPVFGLVAPVAGQVRYLDVAPAQGTPAKPTRVATVWANGKPSNVDVPAGATFAGRLADDKATVPAGMPVASARYAGYGIVAEIDGANAYRISDSLGNVQAQIKNGPGPFACTVLGTIAALPAGTIPEPPAPTAKPPASGPPTGPGGPGPERRSDTEPSTPTGLRLVCTAPAGVKLINGVDATLQVVTEKATNVLTVPVEAVAGSQGKGKVDIVKADNTRETRDVELGLTDGKVIEIRSGLTGEETIAVPGPNLPPGRPEGDPNGKGGKGQ
ncbi:efflux RND transporter periplasmic adaptor subunit [Longispora sp. K20-0274]|uniref:efflux RND transporter periplasmic adaptor subunit n=1 Tax=Longispora sp. K20-0274 TaxID=3088255 RepID=UPI00399B0AA4